MEQIQDIVLAAAQTPWVLVALGLLCFIDGFFPPVPSESIVIALAALGASGNGPPLWLVVPVAALGAFAGDQLAYVIGRALPLEKVPVIRGPAGAKALRLASAALSRRGTVLILSARFIPVGRVAVNLAAGATGFPHLRFIVVDAVAAVLWACYSAAMGFGAGAALHDHPLLAVVIGVLGGVLLGLVLDKIIGVVHRRWLPDLPQPETLDLPVDEDGRWDPGVLEEEQERAAAEAAVRVLREETSARRHTSSNDGPA